jgi:threonine/homoserine/homoserine lactone efflux protein
VIPLPSLASYFVQGGGYGLAAAAQPGAFQTFVISQTLANGWRRTLPAALAPLISDGPILVLMLVILTRLPEWTRALLHLASGVFILYLAWSAVAAWRKFDPTGFSAPAAGQRSLLKAAVMNRSVPAHTSSGAWLPDPFSWRHGRKARRAAWPSWPASTS